MIKSWKHKGLEQFYLTGNTAGIGANYAKRLKMVLQVLDAIEKPQDLSPSVFGFHKLTGDLKGYFSMKVSGNWRVIFKFEGNDTILVDYVDYH